MITIGICFIYYGLALWLYQIYGWLANDLWAPYSVSTAWQVFFGAPPTDMPVVGVLIGFIMELPLSLALLLLGLSILGAVLGGRRFGQMHERGLRRSWILEQCGKAGYRPWNVRKVLAELEAETANGKKDNARRVS